MGCNCGKNNISSSQPTRVVSSPSQRVVGGGGSVTKRIIRRIK